ncbi:hypothetical protein ACFL2V_03285 [Pseudomonadota bacterium]
MTDEEGERKPDDDGFDLTANDLQDAADASLDEETTGTEVRKRIDRIRIQLLTLIVQTGLFTKIEARITQALETLKSIDLMQAKETGEAKIKKVKDLSVAQVHEVNRYMESRLAWINTQAKRIAKARFRREKKKKEDGDGKDVPN